MNGMFMYVPMYLSVPYNKCAINTMLFMDYIQFLPQLALTMASKLVVLVLFDSSKHTIIY